MEALRRCGEFTRERVKCGEQGLTEVLSASRRGERGYAEGIFFVGDTTRKTAGGTRAVAVNQRVLNFRIKTIWLLR